MDSLTVLRSAFAPVPGYLDAATCGLPARATVDAMRGALDTWQAGKADLAVSRANPAGSSARRSATACATTIGSATTSGVTGTAAGATISSVGTTTSA